MQRYFFDLGMSGKKTPDTVGVLCRDDQHALRHAWAALPSLVGEADERRAWQRYDVTIRREDGQRIGRIGVSIEFEQLSVLASAIIQAKDNIKPLLE